MKNNKIGIIEYLDILQKEWIQFFWAYNTFPEKYRNKYVSLMADRKTKIIDITKKIMVSNIFDDISVLENVFDKIFNRGCPPNFIYRNTETSGKIHHFNMVYFYKNSRVNTPDGEKKVKSITPDLKTLTFQDGTSIPVEVCEHMFFFDLFTKWF